MHPLLFIPSKFQFAAIDWLVLAAVATLPNVCFGQASGNAAFGERGGPKERAEGIERQKRTLGQYDLPPSGATFVEASVLMNVQADEYVAVFALSQDGETAADCARKMDALVKEFSAAVNGLGIGEKDLFVDFVAQNKIYGFDIKENIAAEKLVGFELKKNLVVRYQDYDLLDKLLTAAGKLKIYDLVKVDYVVKDSAKVHNRLMEEAAKIIKQKTSRYEKLLGLKLGGTPQIYAERPAIHYPLRLYDHYVAQQSESVDRPFVEGRNFTVHRARKSQTFYYNGLDANGFDEVINPSVIEPPVQFTLYLKVKFDAEPVKAP